MIVKVEVNLLSHQLNLTAFSLSTLSINPSRSDDEREKKLEDRVSLPVVYFSKCKLKN